MIMVMLENKNKIIGISIVVIFLLFIIGSYNGIQSSKVNVDTQWSQVENQMQRRYDLIPNLVNTVKGYSIHEEKTIQAVADARAKMGSAQTPVQKDEANGELSNALSRLMMVVENYPDLKANQQYNQLMNELAGTENRISVARRDYVGSVKNYNIKITTFPGNIFASIFGFQPVEQFKAFCYKLLLN
jgi:LemA protein